MIFLEWNDTAYRNSASKLQARRRMSTKATVDADKLFLTVTRAVIVTGTPQVLPKCSRGILLTCVKCTFPSYSISFIQVTHTMQRMDATRTPKIFGERYSSKASDVIACRVAAQ